MGIFTCVNKTLLLNRDLSNCAVFRFHPRNVRNFGSVDDCSGECSIFELKSCHERSTVVWETCRSLFTDPVRNNDIVGCEYVGDKRCGVAIIENQYKTINRSLLLPVDLWSCAIGNRPFAVVFAGTLETKSLYD